MAQLSVEQSAYIQNQQNYLANVRVSQFAKFLNKNPLFVTYYPVNQAQSSTDAGTGAVYEEIGPNSPIRFNKILNLPAFNISELRPDMVTDEGGYDINMDMTDIAFIAGTIRPKPGDYMRLDMGGVKPLLFRCTTYRHNSIMSNDYYQADFDLIDINQDYLALIEHQVEETYTCKFENIGTNQKVFLTEAEDSAIADAQDLIDKLTTFYNDVFYNESVDSFVLYGGNPPYDTQWYCDNYLIRFINESRIFQNDASDYTKVLPYLELLPLNFDMLYRRSVWYAVLQRSTEYLHKYLYAWNRLVQKKASPLVMASIPAIHPNLEIMTKYVKPDESLPEDLQGKIWVPGSVCGFSGAEPHLRTYFPSTLQFSLADRKKEGELNVVENMIFSYVTGGLSSIHYTKKELVEFAFAADLFSFMHIPIVIYILKQHLASLTVKTDT